MSDFVVYDTSGLRSSRPTVVTPTRVVVAPRVVVANYGFGGVWLYESWDRMLYAHHVNGVSAGDVVEVGSLSTAEFGELRRRCEQWFDCALPEMEAN